MNLYQMSFGQETHEVAPGYSHFHLVGYIEEAILVSKDQIFTEYEVKVVW